MMVRILVGLAAFIIICSPAERKRKRIERRVSQGWDDGTFDFYDDVASGPAD